MGGYLESDEMFSAGTAGLAGRTGSDSLLCRADDQCVLGRMDWGRWHEWGAGM